MHALTGEKISLCLAISIQIVSDRIQWP